MFDLSDARSIFRTIGCEAFLLKGGDVVLDLGWEDSIVRLATAQERLGLLAHAAKREPELHELVPARGGEPTCELCRGAGYVPEAAGGLICGECWGLGWLV